MLGICNTFEENPNSNTIFDTHIEIISFRGNKTSKEPEILRWLFRTITNPFASMSICLTSYTFTERFEMLIQVWVQ